MTTGDRFLVTNPATHPVAVVADQTLTAAESRYVDAAAPPTPCAATGPTSPPGATPPATGQAARRCLI
ncbi:hypothetical protein [Mycolicibacterium baixiangningiae]|uniref:hypothetical protein n=1 Tax=Mycolicibacterium baixiangningiae TaxID=2761578 RepID=UPI0018D0627D|nr:hypothetical protein [Mycolicibacterium baixiangningiae]